MNVSDLNASYRLIPDGPLLEAVLAKDQVAWTELIRRYRALVFRCITKVAAKYDAVLSNEDANEIFGDMCFNLLRDDMRKLRAYDPARGAKLGSWLGLLAINTAYDYLRQTIGEESEILEPRGYHRQLFPERNTKCPQKHGDTVTRATRATATCRKALLRTPPTLGRRSARRSDSG